MKRSARIASAAVATALMMGVAGPATTAQAASPAHPKHAKVAPVKTEATKATKAATKATKAATKATKAAAKDKRLVLKDIAHLDTLLGKFAASVRASKTTAEHKAAVLANVAADRTALAGLSQVLKDADATVTDLKQVRRDLKGYRVSNYQVAVSLLRRADALTTVIGALRAEVVAGSQEALALAEAERKLGEAVEGAQAITATSGAIAIHAVKVLLSGANADVEAVKDAVATGDPTTEDSTSVEPTTDEPTTDDSTTEDRTVGDPVADPAPSPSAVAVRIR